MHTTIRHHPDVGEIRIHHNGGWDGDAIVVVRGQEYTIPACVVAYPDELKELRTIVEGMSDQVRRVVAHWIQESRIKSLETEVFALKDGLRSWKVTAEKAEKRVQKLEEFEAVIDEVTAVVEKHDSSLCGTLAERVRKAIDGHRE